MTTSILKTAGDLSINVQDPVELVSNVQMIDHSVRSESNDEISFSDIFSVLWRRKWLIILSMILTTSIALLLTLSAKSTYRADAMIQIERKGPEVVSFGNTENVAGGVDSLNSLFFHTSFKALKSRKLLSLVIEDTNLQDSLTEKHDKPLLISQLKTEIKVLLGFSKEANSNSKVLPTDLTDLLLGRLSIRPIKKTHLVEIYYEGRSPQEAKAVVSSLVAHFIQLQANAYTETGEFAKDFLNKQVNEAQQRLRQSEQDLVAYSNKKGILGIDENQTRHVTKLNHLNLALVQAEVARSAAESKYRQVQGDSGRSSNALNNPVIINLKARLLDLEGQYQNKLKIFKPDYPDMLRLKQQINDAHRKLASEKVVIATTKHSDLKSAFLATKSQERRLRRELARFNKKLQSLQNSGVDYNRLKREVESNARLYKNLLQRVDEVSVASLINTSNIKVVDPAIMPTNKYRPRSALNIVIGLLSGLFLGFGLVFLREIFDHSLKSTEDLQRTTGVPVLGLVPKPKKIKQAELAMATVLIPNAPFSEAYRLLSANVRFTLVQQSGKVLLVTSCSPNEGKTITACNMACAYAQMGMKVLLIDADLRKSTVAEKLKIYNKRGLSNYLGDNEDLLNVTQQLKAVSGLFVIPSGSYTGDIMRMISDDKMKFLISEAEKKFDFIIIDSPTVGNFADTLLLSSLASSTLIVVDEAKFKMTKIHYTIEQLMRVKSAAIGFLLLNSTNPLVTDHDYEKHYRQSTPSFLFSPFRYNFWSKNKTVTEKKIKVKGVKKPFWRKSKKGINLGYMN